MRQIVTDILLEESTMSEPRINDDINVSMQFDKYANEGAKLSRESK